LRNLELNLLVRTNIRTVQYVCIPSDARRLVASPSRVSVAPAGLDICTVRYIHSLVKKTRIKPQVCDLEQYGSFKGKVAMACYMALGKKLDGHAVMKLFIYFLPSHSPTILSSDETPTEPPTVLVLSFSTFLL